MISTDPKPDKEPIFRCQIYLKGSLAKMLNDLYDSGQYYNYQDLFRQIVREWGISKGLLKGDKSGTNTN